MKPGNPKGNQPWTFIGRTDAEAEAILWPPDVKSWLFGKDPDPGKDWGKEERGNRGWDGGMASLTQWIWVWANSGRWWRTGKRCVLQSIGSQRVRHNWVTEQQQISIKYAGKKGGRTTPKMKINFIRKSPNPLLQNLAARCALAFRIVWLLPYHEYYIAPPTLLSSTQ